MFVIRLLEWQNAGYVSVNVWNDIEGLINRNVLPDDDITPDSVSWKLNTDASNDPAEPEVEENDDQQSKLQKSDPVNDRLVWRVASNVFPSMRKHLALGPMKLGKQEYESLLRENESSGLRNFRVILLSLHTAKLSIKERPVSFICEAKTMSKKCPHYGKMSKKGGTLNLCHAFQVCYFSLH